MNPIERVTRKIVKLHENAMCGNHQAGYDCFKSALKAVILAETNGVRKRDLKVAKSILAEYADVYRNEIKHQKGRVVINSSAPRRRRMR